MRLAGFDIHVMVADEAQEYPCKATEYQHSIHLDGRSVTAWIEAQLGAEYWIQYRYRGRASLTTSNARSIKVYIDGELVACKLAFRTSNGVVDVKHTTSYGAVRPFKFCPPEFSSQGEKNRKRLASTGSIVITVHNAVVGAPAYGQDISSPDFIDTLYDTSKIASFVSATTRLGDVEQHESSVDTYEVEDLELMGTGCFIYKTRDDLIAQGILSPSPARRVVYAPDSPLPPWSNCTETKEKKLQGERNMEPPPVEGMLNDDGILEDKQLSVASSSQSAEASLSLNSPEALDRSLVEDGEVPLFSQAQSASWLAVEWAKQFQNQLGVDYESTLDLFKDAKIAQEFQHVDATDQLEWIQWTLLQWRSK